VEVQFTEQIEQLKLGAGATFHGEGILAITKGLLQAGVAYVGGYQGAPVSHLLDVLVQARPLMETLGVHVEACSNEASAAAMLGASIHYPLRGCVTWKSIVGTNVAADALSNLASPGVTGGALVVVGEDYGEGASVIQERTHAYALKSTMALFDPRPELGHMARLVGEAFALSEASNMPAMMELRIRACHVRGSFIAADNVAPKFSTRQLIDEPARFDYMRLAHPPVTFRHEKLKVDQRLPAAERFIVERGLNEVFGVGGAPRALGDMGLIVQGGLVPALVRALQQLGLADDTGAPRLPVLCLNVTYPLAPPQLVEFCTGKRAVLVVEEGSPEYIEKDVVQALRQRDVSTPVHGKKFLPAAGEYTVEVLARGLLNWFERHSAPAAALAVGAGFAAARDWLVGIDAARAEVAKALGSLPARPPTFCIGCPERPVFAALQLAQQQVGPVHVSADIGCHAFATFEPFSSGHSILGYGMSLASRAGVSPMLQRRSIAVMGDGGFWHNGLLTGVQAALFNGDDAVLLIMKNGYTSATGTQDILNTPDDEAKAEAAARGSLHQSLVHKNQTIEATLKGIGVPWLRVVHSYEVDAMRRTLQEALTTPFAGLKVIVAEGECQLERQRRIKPWLASLRANKERVVRVKYGVDEDVCTGDHACIRLSGCPTLTLKDNPDPLRTDPVATVIDGCVGCGLCGENAHAASLCPSFYRAEVVQNPGWPERLAAWLRERLTAPLRAMPPLPLAAEGRGEGGVAQPGSPSPQPSRASGSGSLEPRPEGDAPR
jgi:indolepyruvate ferredoxin oxidoreductase alpha subunit